MLLGIYEGLNASGDIQGVFFLHWYPPKKLSMEIFSEFFLGRFDTSGSMIPLLVPEIWPWAFFCDGRRSAGGIGYSSSWMGASCACFLAPFSLALF